MAHYKLYEYANCSSCKKALKFLDQRKIPYQKISIVESPPNVVELEKMLEYLGGDFKKLFNTSGQVYRELGLSEKMDSMTADKALKLLTTNGKLIKRPFLLGPSGGTVGFKEEQWNKLLAK